MNSSLVMLIPALYFAIAGILFTIMLSVVEKWDPDTNLNCSVTEGAVHCLGLFTISVLSYEFWGTTIEQILSVAVLTILQFCAHTDYKTKFVYRFFNLIFIGVAVIFFIVHVGMNPMPSDKIMITIGTLVVYIIIFAGLHKVKTYGTGDILSLIGNAFYIVLVLPAGKFFAIEILLWHYCIASILLIIMNLTNMNWKKMKLKTEIAFLPQIYLSTIGLMMYFVMFKKA